MSALPRAHRIAAILGLLLGSAAAAAFASPAEEYLLDMAIVVHPASERATPAETAARTQQPCSTKRRASWKASTPNRRRDVLPDPVSRVEHSALRPRSGAALLLRHGHPVRGRAAPDLGVGRPHRLLEPERSDLRDVRRRRLLPQRRRDVCARDGAPGRRARGPRGLGGDPGLRRRRIADVVGPAGALRALRRLRAAAAARSARSRRACPGSAIPPAADPYRPNPRFSACVGTEGWCDGYGRCVAASGRVRRRAIAALARRGVQRGRPVPIVHGKPIGVRSVRHGDRRRSDLSRPALRGVERERQPRPDLPHHAAPRRRGGGPVPRLRRSDHGTRPRSGATARCISCRPSRARATGSTAWRRTDPSAPSEASAMHGIAALRSPRTIACSTAWSSTRRSRNGRC